MKQDSPSIREQRIRKITHLYYSRKDIQKAIFEFSKDREICPRYFEGFGKRPDSFQYINDIFELVKKGATSFHCSEELWQDPLQISTKLKEEQIKDLRIGWDLLLDIDCKWFDYSKLAVKAIIKVLNKNGLKNIGLKFSGSKGWHIIIPWKAFPKEMGGIQMKNLFPEIPRKIIAFLRFYAERELKKILPEDFEKHFKGVKIKRGIKCNICNEIADEYENTKLFCDKCNIKEERKLRVGNKEELKCSHCNKPFESKEVSPLYECTKCNINSIDYPGNFSKYVEEDLFDLMGLDIILVSPRHLFRMPYSLHEKTALSSVVLEPEELENFQLKDADPLKVKIKNFMPEVKEGEASELLMQALDWYKEINPEEEEKKNFNFKPIKLTNLSEQNFPPCVQRILKGLSDGRKRALFVLINLFRSVGMDKEELEKRINDWNKKNEVPLKQGYIKSQLLWSFRKKPIMSPNCKEFYKGIGVCEPDNFCKLIKNPVNYIVKKNFQANKKTKPINKDNFKNNN